MDRQVIVQESQDPFFQLTMLIFPDKVFRISKISKNYYELPLVASRNCRNLVKLTIYLLTIYLYFYILIFTGSLHIFMQYMVLTVNF